MQVITIKILFVIAHIGKGGGEAIQATRIIKEIRNKGHECKLLTLSVENKDSSSIEEPCDTEYVSNISFPKGIYRLHKRLKELAKDYDVIQCFDIYYSLPAAYLIKEKPVFLRLGMDPYIEPLNDKLYFRYLVTRMVLPRMFRKVNVITNSIFLKEKFSKFNPMMIRNGFYLEDEKRKESKKILRKRLGIPIDKRVLLFTGKVIPRKNIEEIFSVLEEFENIFFLVVGSINEDNNGKKYYASLLKKYTSFSDKYRFVGEVSSKDVKEYLKASDIYVFPSRLEGSPNSIIEAMAYGIPVICSDNVAHREIITQNKNGFIYKNRIELIKYIKKCFNDKDITSKIVHEARISVERNHDIEKSAEEYLSSYKKAIKR